MSEIQLRGVTKRYHDLEVIAGLDLTIDDGAFTVMVGPSGCGKSTLLRMVAGLERITGGDLLIDGQRSNDLDPVQRGVAMVFQNYALYPHMTVARNIGFSLKMAGLPRAEVERRVNEAADTLKIAHLLGRKPAELSGGQRQRVAIGRAIVRDPNVFLFDEPLSNLDAELRVTMRVELARLHRRLRSTMLYVTHDQVEAMTLADKIVVMREGRIEQIGAPHQLYTDPDNVFVAGFIGSPRMNFLEANAYDGALRLSDGAAFAVPAGAMAGPCTVGLRPEHLSIGGAGEHTLGVSVDMIEYLGGTRYVYGRLADETPVTIEVREDGGAVQPGDRVQATFQGAQIMLFGPDGRRIRSGIPILN